MGRGQRKLAGRLGFGGKLDLEWKVWPVNPRQKAFTACVPGSLCWILASMVNAWDLISAATSAQDRVVKHLDLPEESSDMASAVAPRRQWSRPTETVVNALHQAEISQVDGTMLVKDAATTVGRSNTSKMQERKGVASYENSLALQAFAVQDSMRGFAFFIMQRDMPGDQWDQNLGL